MSQHDKFGKQSLIACKSNHFSTLEDLATDVCRRIEHHNTDPANVMPLIQGMFLPVTKEKKGHHSQVLQNLMDILDSDNALPNSQPISLRNGNNGDNDSIDQSSDVISIDDCTCSYSAEFTNSVSGFTADTSQGSILCGTIVLARSTVDLQYRQAFVLRCNGTQVGIQFFGEGAQEHDVSINDVKNLDWVYWRTEMQSWSYKDFKEDTKYTDTQIAGQKCGDQGLVALEKLSVGTVVTEHTGVSACDKGGEEDTGEQCNCELLWVDRPNSNTTQKSQEDDNKVGFVVTTREVQKGEMLKWPVKLRECGREGTPNRSQDAQQRTQSEPVIMQSIMFSMQGSVDHAEAHPFDLAAYLLLWKLRMPLPRMQTITIANTDFESRDFGISIRPFLHQATIDLLLMNNITEWLDIDANNSFVIHLALAMNKNPLALHTMFARNCTRKASQNCVWTSDVLDAVYPSSLNIEIVILVKQEGENTYTSKKYGSGETPESRVVLVKDGMDYSWLEDNRIRDVHIQQFQQNCRNENCVKWETLTKKSVFIRGCDNSKNEAPAHWKKTVWEAACNKVGLQSSDTGKWVKKPYGCDLDLSLQDGSLTPQSFEQLHKVLLARRISCGSVADLGSEAGHAVAQFAFKPFVNQVIGIEIQYAWVAYSVIIMQHLQAESCKDEYYLADIHILHGSFLDTALMEWEAALSRADLCICNNVNWEKGARARPVPQEQQSMKGEYRNSINANVAHLLVDIMKLNSHVLVFDAASFANQAFQRVQTLNLMATWSTLAQGTQVHLLKIYPTHFRVLNKALKTLCQAKNCDFESLPRDWWEHEVQKKRDTFLR